MKLINKSILTIIFSLFTIVAFAQRSGLQQDLSRDLNRDLSGQLNTSPTLTPIAEGPADNVGAAGASGDAPGPGGCFECEVPIDDYQFYLVGLGVLLTGIVVYRRNQLQKA
ncbi:hypothetical protein NLM59_03370 [Weeksellaceae bacterium KMM 9724]|uniref:hypothetical protein n=1 Tax=Profundicola chukchiensis TaxID=2961959 RepID=UPI002438683F|nr:hypothetical protein [Profundicola chukchiensis]MDG4949955.1 hypothetical protein [Profundicola chukchiensis]